jgi:hypothetical protein
VSDSWNTGLFFQTATRQHVAFPLISSPTGVVGRASVLQEKSFGKTSL